ncbi:flagellar basal body rod protein FlgC [Asticcacaulis sp. EMRT-3]|uniref:flagellar basal body rod protein FlgC n=1 Tax=Asticcacaulis sp. EMRT-3 TaxID=3040349 RepID=UPI0024AF3E92|nr:flagellar basal body rod protein FlgC [Asticcacaulis sp. EMRT-3]MDI7773809.1 flagellar basal body rod protein FlgC [Asticcacaulis sp. EMRT-3]
MVDMINSDQTMAVAASALKAQQARMRIIAENIANADSTGKTPGSDPYRRQVPVFTSAPIDGATGVELARVAPDTSAFTMEYDPSHPAANANGYVKKPNVNPLIETMDMREAQRAYEANMNVIETSRDMTEKVLDILQK